MATTFATLGWDEAWSAERRACAAELPALGDWVLLRDGGGLFLVEHVLPRQLPASVATATASTRTSPAARYGQRLSEERSARAAARREEGAARNSKARWKSIHKAVRQRNTLHEKLGLKRDD